MGALPLHDHEAGRLHNLKVLPVQQARNAEDAEQLRVDVTRTLRRFGRQVAAVPPENLLPPRLRRILPESMQKWAFARLARLVRRQMQSEDLASFRELELSDFSIGKERLEASLDLLAIGRKAASDVATPVPGD